MSVLQIDIPQGLRVSNSVQPGAQGQRSCVFLGLKRRRQQSSSSTWNVFLCATFPRLCFWWRNLHNVSLCVLRTIVTLSVHVDQRRSASDLLSLWNTAAFVCFSIYVCVYIEKQEVTKVQFCIISRRGQVPRHQTQWAQTEMSEEEFSEAAEKQNLTISGFSSSMPCRFPAET